MADATRHNRECFISQNQLGVVCLNDFFLLRQNKIVSPPYQNVLLTFSRPYMLHHRRPEVIQNSFSSVPSRGTNLSEVVSSVIIATLLCI